MTNSIHQAIAVKFTLFWVEGLLGDDIVGDVHNLAPLEFPAPNEVINEDQFPQISLHAIAGTHAPKTMRISGTLM